MRDVLLALIPGLLAHAWFFGPGIVVQVVLATAFAVGFESAMLYLRGKPQALYLGDGSAVVTAVLFALCIPPLAPWWIAAVGMGFAIVLAKHLYGGLGYNVFNPAMVGYVVVLISFPAELTRWLPPGAIAEIRPDLTASLHAIFLGSLPADLGWDAITQATPLDSVRTGIAEGRTVAEIRSQDVFGDFGGLGWEWIANWFAIGGLWLLWRRVISWHVPVAMIGTIAALGLAGYLIDPGSNPSPLQHVFSGAIMLGAFFIATDPVSGCTSTRGRLIFGAGVGIFTLVIRRWGGYPDGVAFAVLLMNMAAPLIDVYTRPRFYGE
ncbi:RnfABCDGE type electron transport complex subunit D [Elongatibacter sediminis]|uniref:Ion-translocating oxidoreductase complex subunit D n=1 Tax=Elongatibacter sediminis TaxID=3119006 RepID=A0AAW9RH52_9GAMM